MKLINSSLLHVYHRTPATIGHRLKVRSNRFSLRITDSWNAPSESVVMAPP